MLGTNKRVDIIRSTKAVTDSGVTDETEVTVYSNVTAAIQPHVISSLPPPGMMHRDAGIVYIREYRVWLRRLDVPDVRNNDYLVDRATGEKFRVLAAIDDAGRKHHWVLRAVM